MKIVKFLDQQGTTLVADTTNQAILRELVQSENSASDLAAKLNLPTLKVWRRMQKLAKAGLLERAGASKVGNVEKKLYRATATQFLPPQVFLLTPKDSNLQEAFQIYADIQKEIVAKVSVFHEIPKEADPVDFALFAGIEAFAEVCTKPETLAKLAALKKKLAAFSSTKLQSDSA